MPEIIKFIFPKDHDVLIGGKISMRIHDLKNKGVYRRKAARLSKQGLPVFRLRSRLPKPLFHLEGYRPYSPFARDAASAN